MSPALAGIGAPAADALDVTVRAPAANGAAMTQPLALIVDDSTFLAMHLARQLEGLGFHAHVPVDAADLHERMAQAALICVELELFHASGFEVTRELAEQCACPLMLLSGSGRKTDLQWGLRAGARAVLQRPVRADALRTALVRIGCGALTR
ncbi:MAG: response regulator [Pseudomonadota bacterium]|nr:response regulator [Pseudomonadota bacterium]